MNKNIALAAVLLAAVAATGCSGRGKKPLPPPDAASNTYGGGVAGNAIGAGSGVGSGTAIDASKGAGGLDLSNKTVYFAYDSAEIDTAGQGVIGNFGRYLTGTATAKMRLEGHTDERGSAEYNIALGERRAQTVARELKALGVTDAQLSVISYGEERPAAPGSSEEAYAKNRRVEINQP